MKLILAIIRPFKLDDVRLALAKLGVQGMTVSEAKGYGRQKGYSEVYRGAEYVVAFLPKLKLEMVVPDALVDRVVEVLSGAATTGRHGDGRIFILDVARAMRVRTAEIGQEAL